jgi:hypothetical protein
MLYDVAIGITSNVLYGGIARVCGAAAVSAQRKQAVEKSLHGQKDEKAKQFGKALEHLQKVVAHRFGTNTKSFDDFLKELTRSAFPEVATEVVLHGADPEGARVLFDAILKNYPQPEGGPSSDDLFGGIITAVKAQYDMLSGEVELLNSISTTTRGIYTKVENINRVVAQMQSFNAERSITKVQIDALRSKVCKQLEARYRYVTLETTKGQRKFSISKLFIEPRFERLSYDELAIPQSKKKNQNRPPDEDLFMVGYADFRNTFKRAVILGDPGGGKSTTVQNICFELSRSLELALEHPDRDGIDASRQRIPFRIVLRTFETRRKQNASYSLFDMIIDEVSEIVPEDRALLAEFVKYCLVSGTSVVLFDGLDEVLNVNTRRSYVELIEQFANAYPSPSVAVTSRYVGYMDAPLDPHYECFSLAEFQFTDIEQYTRKLLATIRGLKEVSVERDVRTFLEQTSRNAEDLRVNPLMLALMVWIFAIKGDVPANRPEIYKECATLMFEKWDQNRGILAGVPSDFELIDLFGFIANEIFGKPELEEGVSKDWLFARMKTYFMGWYDDKVKATEVSKQLVEFLVGRAWVLSEVGQDVFKFTHRTFLEYFYARYANAQLDTVGQLIKILRPRILKAQMDVVNHLSLQMFTFREPRKMKQAVEELVNIFDAMKSSKSEAENALLFFSRALEYLVMPEPQYRQALGRTFERMLKIGAGGESYVSVAISNCVSHATNRIGLLQQIVYEIFRKSLRGDNRREHEFIATILGGGRLRRKDKLVLTLGPAMRSRLYSQLMEQLKQLCVNELAPRGDADIEYARLLIEVDPNTIVRFYAAHGDKILFAALNDANFQSQSAVVKIARRLTQNNLRFPVWASADIKLMTDFAVERLRTKIAVPAGTGTLPLREIGMFFASLERPNFARFDLRGTGGDAAARIAAGLMLAMLAEMERNLLEVTKHQAAVSKIFANRKAVIRAFLPAENKSKYAVEYDRWLAAA